MNTCIAAETGCFHQTTRSHLDPGGHHFAESCDSLTRDHCAQQWVHGSLLHTISIQCFDFLWKAYSHRILQFTLHRVRAVGTIASESLDLGREIEREAAWAPARISVWLAVVCISPAFTASNILCFQNPPSPLPVAHLFPSAILVIVTSPLSSWTSVSTDPPLRYVSPMWWRVWKRLLHSSVCSIWEVASSNTKSVASFWTLTSLLHITPTFFFFLTWF